MTNDQYRLEMLETFFTEFIEAEYTAAEEREERIADFLMKWEEYREGNNE